MKIKFCIAILFMLFTRASFAQLYIEPIAGYQLDVSNKESYKMINSAIQLSYKFNKHAELFFRVQKSWAIKHISYDSSFTTNPSLPLYDPAKKTIKPSTYSFAFGNLIRLNGANKHNIFSLMFFGGYVLQKIGVEYEYDKNNYTIVNPDKTLERDGFFVGGGFEYMRMIKQNRLLFQLNFSSPPIVKKTKYPYSFNLLVPFSINVGYSIMLKKSSHEK